jgi:hypothetical protein
MVYPPFHGSPSSRETSASDTRSNAAEGSHVWPAANRGARSAVKVGSSLLRARFCSNMARVTFEPSASMYLVNTSATRPGETSGRWSARLRSKRSRPFLRW